MSADADRSGLRTRPLRLTVNGRAYGPVEVPEDMMLVDVLHEYLGLTGTRFGCGQGVCRACTVIVDDERGPRELRSCITGAHYFQGKRIRTVEGHARRDESGRIVELSPVQQAFLDHFSFQCGYCTPGFVNAATVLLERLRKQPVARADLERTITEALDPHLCRCTGYVRYYQAVRQLALDTPGLVRDGDAREQDR
ncbi:(2Fe-2S)-binding protein [Lysobacter sp. BMK333-48F3]|uniref:(2Fe-2S)-binding protein n=1 Tax=Lysobacter sp. BMK333-48F3 TaxID=2867962 RepID=UPI001C8B9186|nr:(2Fe-2S)-binding protein [Lysobacter sp. BMK333-48F3]MBX9399821.1 (2Fe-2S)-binding protein [Lysobacter sp. BMK333-48F3]